MTSRKGGRLKKVSLVIGHAAHIFFYLSLKHSRRNEEHEELAEKMITENDSRRNEEHEELAENATEKVVSLFS
jgi:fatty acid-binding protein DegV